MKSSHQIKQISALLRNLVESLIVAKIVNQVKYEVDRDGLEAKNVSRDSHGQNISDKPWFSCEIAHFERSSISSFHGFFASIVKIFILGGRLGTML